MQQLRPLENKFWTKCYWRCAVILNNPTWWQFLQDLCLDRDPAPQPPMCHRACIRSELVYSTEVVSRSFWTQTSPSHTAKLGASARCGCSLRPRSLRGSKQLLAVSHFQIQNKLKANTMWMSSPLTPLPPFPYKPRLGKQMCLVSNLLSCDISISSIFGSTITHLDWHVQGLEILEHIIRERSSAGVPPLGSLETKGLVNLRQNHLLGNPAKLSLADIINV